MGLESDKRGYMSLDLRKDSEPLWKSNTKYYPAEMPKIEKPRIRVKAVSRKMENEK